MLKNYTALDLKNQRLIYILENYYSNPKLRSILNNHVAETLLLGGILCTWVEKINRTMTWGDLELINVISLMLNLKISILDYAGGTANIVTWHFGCQKSIKGVHLILIYNGSTHFTETSNFHHKWGWGTHITLFLHCTLSLNQTLSNSSSSYFNYNLNSFPNNFEPSQTIFNIFLNNYFNFFQ